MVRYEESDQRQMRQSTREPRREQNSSGWGFVSKPKIREQIFNGRLLTKFGLTYRVVNSPKSYLGQAQPIMSNIKDKRAMGMNIIIEDLSKRLTLM
jgi:hypothetical protein